jgi:hypothetical protein
MIKTLVMKRFYRNFQKAALLATLFLLISGMSYAANHFTTVWDGENGQNHMNFVVVSAISEDIPLAANDEIAVYSGTSCVGAKKLIQTISVSNNTTFLTIPASQKDGLNNGFTDNDTIIFKIWDSVNQKEMQAKAITYRNNISTWVTNGKFSAGATAVVEIVSYTEYTQTINLKTGYNMVSTYVTPKNPNICAITKTLLDQGYLVKIQDETGQSYENWGATGWINNLGAIQNTEGYQIRVVNNCQFQVVGRQVTLPLDIQLKIGWNIISFPYSVAVDGMNVIQTLIDQGKLVKVQDESGYSIENWGLFGGWKNSIGNLIPGKAYKIKLNADAILTIPQSYLKSSIAPVQFEKADHFSTLIEGNGVDHMNINMVNISESGIVAGDELAAFDGELCVGTLKITDNQILSGNASLTASYSTDDKNQNGFKVGDPIQIKIWSQISGKESIIQSEILKGQMTYERNASVLVKVVSLSTSANRIEDLVQVDVFPNPAHNKVTVRFSQIPDAGSQIEIMDLSGRKITSRQFLNQSEEFNLEQQSAGIYLVKSIIGSKEIIQKLIINN